ncbi:MAG: hypothetical protein R2991_03295 [Thermoanaerobaculia bacterium]
MLGPRPWRWMSLPTAGLLWLGALGVAEHQAESPQPYARGESISEVGHEHPDRSLHLDAAVVKPPHTCVVCWLGSAGLAVPGHAASLAHPGSAPVDLAAPRSFRSNLRDAPSSRGPPLA